MQLAFAATINWAQGQSIKHVGLDIHISVFAHGQLYVALSQMTAKQNIKVLLPHDNFDSKANNIMYDDMLLQ
jgi:ATP-dependent exoDNAse (exonuclease V) alpha subunit